MYRQNILKRMKLDQETSPAKLIYELYKRHKLLKGIYADTENFNLNNVFKKLKIEPDEYIYINWFRFDNIDKMRYEDVIDYFHYLWYPQGPDDMDIFDKTLKWIITIDHSSSVYWIKFASAKKSSRKIRLAAP